MEMYSEYFIYFLEDDIFFRFNSIFVSVFFDC